MRINVTSNTTVPALAREIERTCAPLLPTDPTVLPAFASTGLPSAKQYRLIFVTDKGVPAFSDGSHWYLFMKGVQL